MSGDDFSERPDEDAETDPEAHDGQNAALNADDTTDTSADEPSPDEPRIDLLAADDDPEDHSWDQFDAAHLVTIASSDHDPAPLIREIVSRHVPDTSPDEPACKRPAPPPQRYSRTAPASDRWASLRDALADDDDDEVCENMFAEEISDEKPWVTPLERIRAREDNALHSIRALPPFELPDHRPDPATASLGSDDSVFDGRRPLDASVTTNATAEEVRGPENAPRLGTVTESRVWDSPADHEMSRAGRLTWRGAVYGALLAAPAALIYTSPFAPRDAVAHYIAASGCLAANYMGVASAHQGEPGYHAHLDEDGNGIACEPGTRRKLKGAGSVAFIRVGDY